MFYEFPDNLTLEEVRKIVVERNEMLGTNVFIEADRDEFVIFNYLIQFDGMFPSFSDDVEKNREAAVLRECRGITFDKSSGQCVVRKYHKFFNVGQNEDHQMNMINWSYPQVILDKIDGSMLTGYLRKNGVLEWHTKMGNTQVSQPVYNHVKNLPQYEEMVRDLIAKNATPIFEWCSLQQRIVIAYEKDQLILTAVRNNDTGQYWSYPELMNLSTTWNIPVVNAHKMDVSNGDFINIIKEWENAEGVVVRFDNGHMLKVKADQYLAMHGTLETLQSEKNVWELILSDKMDDAKALMSPDNQRRVDKFSAELFHAIGETAKRLKKFVDDGVAMVGNDRKRFSLEIVNVSSVPKNERSMLFRIADGEDSFAVLKDYLLRQTGTGTKINEARSLVNNVAWNYNMVLDA